MTVLVPKGNGVEKNAAMVGWGAQVVEYGRDFDVGACGSGKARGRRTICCSRRHFTRPWCAASPPMRWNCSARWRISTRSMCPLAWLGYLRPDRNPRSAGIENGYCGRCRGRGAGPGVEHRRGTHRRNQFGRHVRRRHWHAECRCRNRSPLSRPVPRASWR